MALSDIDRAAVLRAVEEFDQLGRDAFLQKHGFGRSRSYFRRQGDNLYDSKAIIGVAHGYSGGGRNALAARQFTGGDATVAETLRGLGFDVQVSAVAPGSVTADNVSPEGAPRRVCNVARRIVSTIACRASTPGTMPPAAREALRKRVAKGLNIGKGRPLAWPAAAVRHSKVRDWTHDAR